MSTEIYIPQAPESSLRRPPLPAIELVRKAQPEKAGFLHAQRSRSAYRMSVWSESVVKRAFDLVCVVPALLVGLPALGVIALAVRCSSCGPIIFRQQRVGRFGQLFTIYKFRTMVADSERCGPSHTAKDDPRITAVGKFLRRWKLDELPQLFNVLRGDMSLVGPRPKLPNHDRAVIPCRPGITGAATLAFRNEQSILSAVSAEKIEAFYQERVAPLKLHLDSEYMASATAFSDLRLLCMTLLRTGHRLTHTDLEALPDEWIADHDAYSTIPLILH